MGFRTHACFPTSADSKKGGKERKGEEEVKNVEVNISILPSLSFEDRREEPHKKFFPTPFSSFSFGEKVVRR